MIISIINLTRGKIGDDEVQSTIRVINRQIAEDFEPYWSFGARLRLEGRASARPRKQELSEMRGDAVLYVWDKIDVKDALGYHDKNNRGIPYGFVLTELGLDESWTATLSHEALELIGDPQSNLLVQGPHPKNRKRTVFHWFEMCDAVQDEIYDIDGVLVSNFVLPLYFTPGEQRGGRNDFLGRKHDGKTLASFGVNPGGYVGYFDPKTGDNDTFDADERARERWALKSRAGISRSILRNR
jgi:hypothetical protein